MRRSYASVAALIFGFSFPTHVAAQRPGAITKLPKRTRAKAKTMSVAAKERARSIRRFSRTWGGVRYKWGGNTKRGIDCSGYSRELFRRVFGVELPRTTRTQIKLGMRVPISPQQLGKGFEPGDLFFYVDPAGIPNHVVVYMGNGKFTHSASGRGVVVDGFKALWGRRIVGRRVLIPARGDSSEYLPIPSAPSFVATSVPCPPTIEADPREIRRFSKQPLTRNLISELNRARVREICEWRALSHELQKQRGRIAKSNRKEIGDYVRWLESIDSFRDEAFR